MTIEEIVKTLETYSDAYYQGKELVDDATFDALEDELRQRDPQNSYFTKLREKAYGQKVKHIYEFVGSIDKIHDVSESKLTNSDITISAKLDGTSMVTYFKDGKLDKAVTRGDGQYGMDITQHYLEITKKYKVRIPANFTGAIRGEVVFTLDNWKKFKAMHPTAKAPRNSGTGLVNQKTTSPGDEVLLDYVVYDVLATNQTIGKDHWDLLTSFGYPVAPLRFCSNLNQYLLDKIFEKWKGIYPIDGLVLRAASVPYLHEDGLYHYTKQQEAFKFQAEIKACTVKEIVWQLGRTGKLTPVLKLESPIELSGAMVTSITAHNAANVKDLRLGAGAMILAYRSGEVIPTIKSVIEPAHTVMIPTHCPYCGSRLEQTATGKDLVCTYEECEGRNKFRIFNFVEQLCYDKKGIGESFEEAFLSDVYAGKATNYSLASFYKALSDCKEFPSLGKADTAIAQDVKRIILSNTFPADKFFLSLGVKLLGTEAAKKLASNEQAALNLLSAIISKDNNSIYTASLIALPGQVALANNIISNKEEISELLKAIYASTFSQFKLNFDTAYRYYAVTGSLSKPRKLFEQELLTFGWQLTENITKCDVLITNDPTSNSSKNQKARSLGKRVLSEEEFKKEFLDNE